MDIIRFVSDYIRLLERHNNAINCWILDEQDLHKYRHTSDRVCVIDKNSNKIVINNMREALVVSCLLNTWRSLQGVPPLAP